MTSENVVQKLLQFKQNVAVCLYHMNM